MNVMRNLQLTTKVLIYPARNHVVVLYAWITRLSILNVIFSEAYGRNCICLHCISFPTFTKKKMIGSYRIPWFNPRGRSNWLVGGPNNLWIAFVRFPAGFVSQSQARVGPRWKKASYPKPFFWGRKVAWVANMYVCMIFVVGIVEPEVAGSDCSFYAKMFA